MSDHLMKAYKDVNGSSGRSPHSARSFWMSRWTNQGSLVAPHSQTLSRAPRNQENDQTMTPFDPSNEFVSFNQGSRRRDKYSAIFSHLLPENNFQGMQIDCQDEDLLYSQHHVLFSRHESTQQRGVKIQPLWSTTDSEKDNFGDAETPIRGRSFDLSAETDTMDVFPLPNGMDISPIAKNTKLAIMETPSRSRTQSMETEHLLSCSEQLSESRTLQYVDERNLQEPDSNRAFKRIKLSSSSSLDRTNMLMNMMMDHSKDENQRTSVAVMTNGESSSLRTKKNPIFESSWIQRWCRDGSVEQERDLSKGVMVCGPDVSKSLDEVDKKRFPSVAAVAMMAKSVDGLHACTYTKRGPLVVWNNKDL